MNHYVRALAVDGSGNVYAGGYFTTAGGVGANYVAKWNGSSWSALGSGMNSSVSALAVDGSGNVYAGGQLTTAGGGTANRVAKWDGSNWSALGSGMNYSVYALATDGSGNVYAGGDFTTAGGVTANYVAQWNGSSWSALGSGMNYTVSELAVDRNGLFAGGSFIFAGNKVSGYFASWQPRVNRSSAALSAIPGALTLGDDAGGFYKPALTTSAGTTVTCAGGLPVTVRLDRAEEIEVGAVRVNGAFSLGPDGVAFGGAGAVLRVEFSEDDAAAQGVAYTEFRAARLTYPAGYPAVKEAASVTTLGAATPTAIRVENGKQIYAISVPYAAIGSTYGAVPQSFVSQLPPVAQFTVSPNPGVGGQSVISFDATSSYHPQPGGSIVRYEWDFGDGSTGTGEIVTHTYLVIGTRTATLTVTDDHVPPLTDQESKPVQLVNAAPVSVPGGPYTLMEGETLDLDGSGSSDPNEAAGDSVIYQWDLNNDGTYTDAAGRTPAISWAALQALGIVAPSTIPIRLRVTDGYGASDIGETTLEVTQLPQPPVAQFTANPNPAAPGQVVTFNASGSYHPQPGRRIVRYAWDFGDGATETGQVVIHAYSAFGSYTANLTLTDDHVPPLTSQTSVEISVTLGNLPPVSDPGGPYLLVEGETLQLDGSESQDPNEPAGDSIPSYKWDLDNDGAFDDASGEKPAISWAELQALGIAAPSTVTIGLRVTDTFGATGTAQTTLQVTLAPVLNDECANATEITEGVPVEGSTANATGDSESSCASDDTLDVWFRYAPTSGGLATVLVDEDNVGVVTLSVFDACEGVELGCNAEDGELSWYVEAGREYFIRLASGEPGGPYSLELTRTPEVTSLLTTALSQVQYNRRNGQYSGLMTITNPADSGITLQAPLRAVISGITAPAVGVANATGVGTDGKPYFDLAALIPVGGLEPGQSLGFQVVFNNLNRERFTFDTLVFVAEE
jgi:PKD repeat protein